MFRGRAASVVAAATSIALGTAGCSFIFVRTPTRQTAREKGGCELRNVAIGADAVLSALAAYRFAQFDRPLLAIKEPAIASDDGLLRTTWYGRNGNKVWAGVFLVTASSAIYGVVQTAECYQLRGDLEPKPPPPGAVRPSLSGGSAAPAAPGAPPPRAAAPVPQQTDDE
jgi:hypothetical protein